MTDREAQVKEMAKKLVVYWLDGMDAVTVRRDMPYQDTAEGTLVFARTRRGSIGMSAGRHRGRGCWPSPVSPR